MSMFPNDIWHNITKWLKPIDLRTFLKTFRDAKHSLSSAQREDLKFWGPILHEYDKIFAQYGWVERVASLGLTPILIYRDKERSYVDLWLADQKQPRVPGTCISRKFGENKFHTDEEREIERYSIFNMILQSLRPSEPGARNYQRKFPTFTLDLIGVLSCPCPIYTWDFSWLECRDNRGKLSAVIWGKGHRELEQRMGPESMTFQLSEFEDIGYEIVGGAMVRYGEQSWHYDFEFPPPPKGWKRYKVRNGVGSWRPPQPR